MSTENQRPGIERRLFISGTAAAVFAGITVIVSGCGSEYRYHFYDDPDAAVGEVSQNHGHRAVVTPTQLENGEALALNIKGTSAHSHIVELTAEDVQAIANGDPVEKVSTRTAGHIHTVTFNA